MPFIPPCAIAAPPRKGTAIDNIIVTSFYAEQCISTSVRDLADLNYRVILPTDAVGALSPRRHEKAMESLRVYAYTETTQNLLNRL